MRIIGCRAKGLSRAVKSKKEFTMTVENEELMQQLQRIAVLSRRSRRAHVKRRIEEQGGNQAHEGCGCNRHGHRDSRQAVAFDDIEAGHGYGNHKCHGGSGRHGQNRVLAVLMMQDGTSQKDLAYLLGIRPQSLSEALDKLEESKMVERRHNENDKRVVNVYLTEAGRSRAGKVAEDRKKNAADVFSVLSDEEKDQLASSLGKIAAKLEEELSEKSASHGKGGCDCAE